MEVTKQRRMVLVIALGATALLTLLSLWMLHTLTTPAPDASRLQAMAGTYQGLEHRGGSSYRLYLRDANGFTDWYVIDSFVDFSPHQLTDTARPGDPATLQYADSKHRSIMALTVNGMAILDYETVRDDFRRNSLWGIALTLSLDTILAGSAIVLLWRRRAKEKRTEEIRLTLEILEKERAEKRKSKPILYHPEERKALEAYIAEAFGPIAQVFFDTAQEGMRVDIAVILPTEDADYYKLVTMGMGARKMDVPPELAERNCAFAELCIYLPPDWRLLSRDSDDTWPFHWLKTIAHMPTVQPDWLGVGHCVHTGPLETDSELTELLLAWAAVLDGSTPRLMLPGSRLVNFYQVLPLYASEVRFRNERGFTRLWQRLMSRGITAVVDLDRECCYDPETDFPLELTPFVWSQDTKQWSLSLYTGDFLQEHFDDAGLEGSGYDWESLAKAYLKKRFPQLLPYIYFDSEDNMFSAYATAEDALRIFALAFREVCGDETAFGELLTRISGNEV